MKVLSVAEKVENIDALIILLGSRLLLQPSASLVVLKENRRGEIDNENSKISSPFGPLQMSPAVVLNATRNLMAKQT